MVPGVGAVKLLFHVAIHAAINCDPASFTSSEGSNRA
jgi:hypothetical protein